MTINFWEEQRKRRLATTWYLVLFFLCTFVTAVAGEVVLRFLAPDVYNPPFPFLGAALLVLIFLTAGLNYLRYLQSGGSAVALSLGAKEIAPTSQDPKERQLMHIMDELAVASSLPRPPVYILEAQEINAFAAGTSPENAAITVTRGAMNQLNRDELQGVLAHEFSHIANGDVKIGMRVAAMIMGFFIAFYIGMRMISATSSTGNGRKKGANIAMIAALLFLVAGALLWFFGSILQAVVSRQREFLADASAVQYTRNPSGICNALKKIAAASASDMPKSSKAYSHLFLNEHPSFWQRLFSTHPPLEKRIAVLEGKTTDQPKG